MFFVWSVSNDGQSENRITPYITLSKPGSALEFPKQKLSSSRKEDILKPPPWQQGAGLATAQASQDGGRPASFRWRRATLANTHHRSQHTHVCGDVPSAQLEMHEDPWKWSECSSLPVNNGTCITAIVIKICDTSRDPYGAIKKILHSVFEIT